MFTSRHTHEEKKRSSTSSTTRITSKQHNNKWQLSIIIISFICFIIFFIIVGITSSRSFYSSPQSFLQDRAKDLHSRSRGQMMQQEKPTRDRQLRIEGTGVGCTGKGGTCRDPIIRSSNEDDKKMKVSKVAAVPMPAKVEKMDINQYHSL